MATRPVPSRNTDGSGVPVFGARRPARIESGETGSGMLLRFIEGATPAAGDSEAALRAPSRTARSGSPAAGVRVAGSPAPAFDTMRFGLVPESGVRAANTPGTPPAAAITPSKPSGASAPRSRRPPRESPIGQSHVAGGGVVGGGVVWAPSMTGAADTVAHAANVTACLNIPGTPALWRVIRIASIEAHLTCQRIGESCTPDRWLDRGHN